MPELTGATPGRDRIVSFTVRGHEFAFRRPSRADKAAIHRRNVVKLGVTGIPSDSELLMAYDGSGLTWESRLEVGLAPRPDKNLGERAPSHWLKDGRIDFDEVNEDEFNEVCQYLSETVFELPPAEELASIDTRIANLQARREVVLKAKKSQASPSPMATSGDTASGLTSA